MPVSDRSTTTNARARKSPEEQRHGAGTCGSDLIEAGDLRDLKRGLDVSGDGPQA